MYKRGENSWLCGNKVFGTGFYTHADPSEDYMGLTPLISVRVKSGKVGMVALSALG